jgi:nucleoside-diphosphate-sugar epimerase
VVGDQSDRACWQALLQDADALVHNSVDWAAFKDGTHLEKNLVSSIELLAASAPLPFVFVSTIAVHHEMLPRWQHEITEDHPLRPASPYGAYKAAVEKYLHVEHHRNGRHVSAVRPSGVYGIDPNLSRSVGHDAIAALRETGRYARPGGGKFVHVEDVVSAIIACAEQPRASGGVFNLADCYARWGDWAQMAAELLGLDAAIDLSGAATSVNTFGKEAVNELGVPLDRGHEGIREHLRQLIPLVS